MRRGDLFQKVRTCVRDSKYVVGEHAVERLAERGTLEWHVVVGIDAGELLAERPDGSPHPSVEVRQILADGTAVLAVWSFLARSEIAKLVTVHCFDARI